MKTFQKFIKKRQMLEGIMDQSRISEAAKGAVENKQAEWRDMMTYVLKDKIQVMSPEDIDLINLTPPYYIDTNDLSVHERALKGIDYDDPAVRQALVTAMNSFMTSDKNVLRDSDAKLIPGLVKRYPELAHYYTSYLTLAPIVKTRRKKSSPW